MKMVSSVGKSLPGKGLLKNDVKEKDQRKEH